MDTKKIKKAELELKKISRMRKELQDYIDCSLKSTLIKSCELCEVVWRKELERLKSAHNMKEKKNLEKKKFEGLSCAELEEIAFDIHTPDDMAQMALTQLISLT